MKIVQVVPGGYVHWLTPYATLADLPEMEASLLEQFKEASDNVQDNWFYDYETGEFTAPPLPEGYEYDEFGVPFASSPTVIAEIEAFVAECEELKKTERVQANQDIIQEAIDAYTLQLLEAGLL
jgi:hypothetical protein